MKKILFLLLSSSIFSIQSFQKADKCLTLGLIGGLACIGTGAATSIALSSIDLLLYGKYAEKIKYCFCPTMEEIIQSIVKKNIWSGSIGIISAKLGYLCYNSLKKDNNNKSYSFEQRLGIGLAICGACVAPFLLYNKLLPFRIPVFNPIYMLIPKKVIPFEKRMFG